MRSLLVLGREQLIPAGTTSATDQLLTVVREYRGDAHVAALRHAVVGPVEALVLHAATGLIDRGRMQETRGWSDAAWEDAVARLHNRGLLHADGRFTEAGAAFRESIEHLKFADPLAKLFSLMGVVECDVTCCLHQSDRT